MDKEELHRYISGNTGKESNICQIYAIKDNEAVLADVSYFTFEPHISVSGSKYGYKREDIYFFDNDIIKEL